MLATRRPTRLRLTLCAALAVAASIGAMFLTPLPGHLLHDPLLAFLEQRYGVIASVARFDVDLLRLRLTATGLEVAARGHPGEPFLTVDEAVVDLAWSSAWRGPSVDGLFLGGPSVSVLQRADGSSNLPAPSAREDAPAPSRRPEPAPAAGAGPPSEPPFELPIRRLDVRELTASWRDETSGFVLHLPATEVRFGAGDGPAPDRVPGCVRTRGVVGVSWRGTTISISGIEGEIAYDGASLFVDRLDLQAAGAGLALHGRVDALFGRPRLALDYEASLDLPHLTPRLVNSAGSLSAAGSLRGLAEDPEASVLVSGTGLRWGGTAVDRLDAALQLTSRALTLDTLGLKTAGGVLAASGAVELSAGWPGELDATWRGLGLDGLVGVGAPELPMVPDAVVEGALSARWSALAPHAVDLSARNRLSSDATSGTAHFEAAGGVWRLTVDHAVSGAGRVTGAIEARMAGSEAAGSADWRTARLTGRIEASCRQLDACFPLLPGPRHAGAPGLFRSPATARLTVGGSLGRPEVTGVLESPAQAVGRESLHGLVARVEADPEVVRITVPGVTLGRNEVAGSLWIRLAGGVLEGRVEGNLADLASLGPLLPPALAPSGRGTIEATVTGRPGRLRGDAVVGFDAVEIGGQHLGAGTGRAELDRTGLLQASLAVPELGARLDAEYRPSGAGSFGIRVQVDDADLDRLSPLAIPLVGRVTGEATAVGTLADLSSARVEVRIAEAAGSVGAVPLGVARPALVVYDARELRVSDLKVALGGSRLEIDGGLSRHGGTAMTVRLRGDAADVAALLAAAGGSGAAPGAVAAAGELSLALTATGTLDAVDLAGWAEVDDGSIVVGDHPPVTGLAARATVREGIVRLDGLRAVWADGTVRGRAELPLAEAGVWLPAAITGGLHARDAPAVVHASIDALSLAGLTAYVPPTVLENASGRLSASLELEVHGGIGESRGRLTLTEAAFEVSGIAVAQRRPTVVDIADGTVTLAAFDWGNEGNRLALGGSLTLRDGFRTDGWLEGDLDLRQVAALTPAFAAAGLDAAGSARVRARLTGPLGSTTVRGFVEIADGEVRIAEPPLVFTDLDGTISLDGDTLTVDRLRGGANGGRLEIGGGWTLGADPEGKHLTVTGTDVALDYPGGLRTEADVELAVRHDETGPVLIGTIEVLRGAYREPITLAGGLLEALGPGAPAALPAPGVESAAGVRLDVRLATREDVVVDNNYVAAAVGGDFRVSGTTSAPGLTGRVTVREGGRVRLGNHTYEIDTGTVDFAGVEARAPELALRARTRAGGYDVTLELHGSRDDLTTSLQSEPPLTEADIASVLLTGRRTGAADALVAVARDQVLGLASADLLAQAGRGVGLDLQIGAVAPDAGAEIRFDPSLVSTDLNPASRLTVGRDLRDDVRLVFSRSLREDDLVWFLDYLPRRDVELRMLFDDDDARTYEFRHAISVGTGPGRAVNPEPPPPRVSDIVVRGDPGTDTAALRDLLSLRVGDRFDFQRQQRDRDRLLAELRGQGFMEALVRTRRAPGEDAGAVDLAYEVVRGPTTELTVSGYRLPRAVRRELEAIWVRAVFDTFLREEIEARVAAYLAGAGYLRAAVDVRIAVRSAAEGVPARGVQAEGSGAVKRIAVRIDPGQRTDERRLTFEGASAEDESGLRELVRARGLDRDAWSGPESLAAAVVSWYRDRGRLLAAAVVGEPRFAGGTAELPVRIASGPSFRVGTVELAGTSARPAAEVLAAAELEEGAAYTERAVAGARARIRTFYRRAGHAAVDVAVRQGIDDASSTVDVRFDVSEGPRQVVQAVVVEGARRTHPALVQAALDIEPGSTVDPEAWNRARTRLYDTGVFRSVDIQATAAEAADVGVGEGAVPVEARVRLEEWPPYQLRYGLRVIDDAVALGEVTGRTLRLGAVGDLSRRNLLGRGLTGGMSARADREQQTVRAFLTLPTPHGRRTATNLFVSRRRESARSAVAGPIDVTTMTAEHRLRPRAGTMLAVSANLDLGSETLLHVGPPSTDRWKLARIDGSAVIDTRDDLFDATRGLYHSSNVEYGAELGGPRTFFKYLGQQFAYRRLGRVVLAAAARVGLATGLGTRSLATARFFTGGGNTVRGYAQDSLGALGSLGVSEGGNALVVLNQEIRVPVGAGFDGVGFVDLGNVFASTRSISVRRLRMAVGLGLRLESPVGLVRLDYGFPVRHRPEGPRGRLFVSLGQAF